MLIIGEHIQTLPDVIAKDPATELPLLDQQEALLKIVLAYQALPYSVAEFGCGKKTSLIIDQLIGKGVPAWALRRGLCLEADMSPAALAQPDPAQRPHSITVPNPIADRDDFDDPVLQRLLNSVGARYDPDLHVIEAGQFTLDLMPEVQFTYSRSHIFTVITFWDEETLQPVDLVIDPTLDAEQMFPVGRMRDYLSAPESLILIAPPLAHFRLATRCLTDAQQERIGNMLNEDETLETLHQADHDALVRRLTGAEYGTVGDPATWTYANNYHGDDRDHTARQRADTGPGDMLRHAIRELLKARTAHDPSVADRRSAVETLVEYAQVRRAANIDAMWSRHELEPLADVALILVYHDSLRELASVMGEDHALLQRYLANDGAHGPLRGLGGRLRRRIDRLATVSTDREGQIDARALNRWFRHAAVETVQQMSRAGLTVFVDKVGNFHGLLLRKPQREALAAGRTSARELARQSIVHASHIDTVGDGGKFDGRLGVAAGIETAHLIADLRQFYDVDVQPRDSKVILMATAYNNEEMTFTGQQVSMSGSAAVAAQAEPERIYRMTNQNGQVYGEELIKLLRHLQAAIKAGEITLVNDLDQDSDEDLLAACSDPTDFYTPHHFERHIEQGPVLDRNGVPIVLVDTIMGIHQEDFTIRGATAEHAALELGVQLRDLVDEEEFGDTRVTVGIMETRGDISCHQSPAAAFHCRIYGERNHAGSIAMADRRDPGVAAGRLARGLAQWSAEHNQQALIGDLLLLPGTNRNVIPGTAELTVGLSGDDVSDEEKSELRHMLQMFAAQSLAGETDLQVCRVEPASFINTAREVRLTMDLRAATTEHQREFRKRIDGIIEKIEAELDVQIECELQQLLEPSPIEETGQVLVMERSYGGSHNPHENELTVDLTRGCILQLLTTVDVLSRESLDDLNMVHCVERYLPKSWLERKERFVSGALHDTCNIAARARELRSARADETLAAMPRSGSSAA